MSVLKLEHVKKDFTLRNGLKTTTIQCGEGCIIRVSFG